MTLAARDDDTMHFHFRTWRPTPIYMRSSNPTNAASKRGEFRVPSSPKATVTPDRTIA